MEFVDPEDGPQVFREPPAPDDRLWRHPSEFDAGGAGGAAGRGLTSARQPRPPWVWAGVSAVGASFLTAGLIALVGLMNVTTKTVPAVVEKEVAQPRPTSVGVVSAPQVVDIADEARPAIVELDVDGPDGKAIGSGVMFRSDGHLLTNHHVIDGASSINVVLASGHQLPGRVVGIDEDSDSAVVKVDGGPYPVATMGTSTDLRLGQTAVAIGSPLGLAGGPSVTVGVVSGLHRQIRASGNGPTLFDMVQTDAPIAPGSSGGALLDDRGAVIGITTVAASSDAGAGLGFATPIDMARSVAEEIVATGKVVHPWLGIEGNDLDGISASDMSVDGGALVTQVAASSPAQKAGMATSDVIVSVDGKTVRSMGDLVSVLRAKAPGDSVSLDVVRAKQHHTMTVVLAPRPS